MKIRHILLLVIGLSLIYISFRSKYESDLVIAIFWVCLLLAAFVTAIISVWLDIRDYRNGKHILNFLASFMSLGLILTIGLIEYSIHSEFNKPSLLKVYYDGDFNGTGIDFKKDGTYIIDNSAIGFSSYSYGTYSISGNKIRLDRGGIEEVIVSPYLKIKDKTASEGFYLYQEDEAGSVLPDETIFRVVSDNR